MTCEHTYSTYDLRGRPEVVRGVGRGFCRDCNRKEINWERPLEGGPVKIVPGSEERRLAEHDAKMLGIGFLVDGKHAATSRVTVIERRHLAKHT